MKMGESADLISILGLPTGPKADTFIKKTLGSDVAAQVIFNDLSGRPIKDIRFDPLLEGLEATVLAEQEL